MWKLTIIINITNIIFEIFLYLITDVLIILVGVFDDITVELELAQKGFIGYHYSRTFGSLVFMCKFRIFKNFIKSLSLNYYSNNITYCIVII